MATQALIAIANGMPAGVRSFIVEYRVKGQGFRWAKEGEYVQATFTIELPDSEFPYEVKVTPRSSVGRPMLDAASVKDFKPNVPVVDRPDPTGSDWPETEVVSKPLDGTLEIKKDAPDDLVRNEYTIEVRSANTGDPEDAVVHGDTDPGIKMTIWAREGGQSVFVRAVRKDGVKGEWEETVVTPKATPDELVSVDDNPGEVFTDVALLGITDDSVFTPLELDGSDGLQFVERFDWWENTGVANIWGDTGAIPDMWMPGLHWPYGEFETPIVSSDAVVEYGPMVYPDGGGPIPDTGVDIWSDHRPFSWQDRLFPDYYERNLNPFDDSGRKGDEMGIELDRYVSTSLTDTGSMSAYRKLLPGDRVRAAHAKFKFRIWNRFCTRQMVFPNLILRRKFRNRKHEVVYEVPVPAYTGEVTLVYETLFPGITFHSTPIVDVTVFDAVADHSSLDGVGFASHMISYSRTQSVWSLEQRCYKEVAAAAGAWSWTYPRLFHAVPVLTTTCKPDPDEFAGNIAIGVGTANGYVTDFNGNPGVNSTHVDVTALGIPDVNNLQLIVQLMGF